MLCTLWDPIVFTSMEYIKLNHLHLKVCDVQIVFTSVGYIKLDHLSRYNVLYKLCNKKLKYIRFLKSYIGVHHFTYISPVTVWLFMELWDTVYLMVTSEYVFCCCSKVCIVFCDSNDKRKPKDDKSIVETCSLCNYLE